MFDMIVGLRAGPHGFHVHQWGVQSSENNCADTGGHYNPFNNNHSAPNSTKRHVGDLGNVIAVLDNVSQRTTTNVSIVVSTYSVELLLSPVCEKSGIYIFQSGFFKIVFIIILKIFKVK